MKVEINNIKVKKDKHNKLEEIMDVSKELKESVKYHGDEDILMTINSKSIKKDLLIFKDELLKDLKRLQTKLYEKAEDNEIYTKEKIEGFNSEIKKYSDKFIKFNNNR